jgi:hypothetical protein
MSQHHGQSGENLGPPQGGSPNQLASKLAADEELLRDIVTSYNINPNAIRLETVTDVEKIIKRIFKILWEDTYNHSGVLAKKERVWYSLRQAYGQAFDSNENLRITLSGFNKVDLNLEHGQPLSGLDGAGATMTSRRRQWLIHITEFQQLFSTFYNELIHAGGNPA